MINSWDMFYLLLANPTVFDITILPDSSYESYATVAKCDLSLTERI